jgi:hypothetical protein
VIPLDLLAAGEFCEIAATGAVDARCASRAEDLGVCVGARVEVLAAGPHGVSLRLDDARVVAVDTTMALRIKVRR